MGDSHVGLQARLDEPGAAQAHRDRRQAATASLVFVNQIRMKIGVMFG